VLSRADAVTTWRRVIGPTDPEAAKEQAPSSLVDVFSVVFQQLLLLLFCDAEKRALATVSQIGDRYFTSVVTGLGSDGIFNNDFSMTKNHYFNTTKHFYLDVLVFSRDLHQKKLVQFFFQFLPP